ncbi:MAG: S-methyl-5'-thioadenosine phosphorylase [Endomicrobium sp.]|jgi:5'-methylthioadenosine phosphorylase|nr:S-methyl-5'-thioadenosine phosphorylase [Endomicrobium sp.]
MNKNFIEIAFIGGSGLYEIDGLENITEKDIDTPFGKPSDKVIIGTINGIVCAFLSRHGKGHILNPSEINQRANIYALRSLGINQIVSFTASGSLKEEIKPKDFVIPDQIFDKTKNRPSTFFEKGIVVHVSMSQPFCEEIRDIIHQSISELGINHHHYGTYVCIEGPQFSTKVESEVNRQAGFSIVGMTLSQEAKLAREAEICYANISLITDYDVWKEAEEVTNNSVVKTVIMNIKNSEKIIKNLIKKLSLREAKCTCKDSLKAALMTSPDKVISSPYYKNVSLLIDKYYKNNYS